MQLIKKFINCKVKVVERDEKELFLREVLNFGYIVGYVLEMYYNYYFFYGIFVILGMVVEMIFLNILFNFDLLNLEFLIRILEKNSIKFF